MYGCPRAIRCDNGPEFTAEVFSEWAKNRKIDVLYIQPGKPTQNAYIERFNRTYRQEVLNAHVFGSVRETRQITEDWRVDYNEVRPHDSLGKLPPAQFLPQPTAPE